MSDLIGPLGSVIGYLGAAAATESFFERLLWPQRFYNDVNPLVLLRLAFLLPMSGPLHGAALESLGTFRDNGLYLGMRRGRMLGTTFYHDVKVKYYRITGPHDVHERIAKNSRNGFWVQVLREVKYQGHNGRLPAPTPEDPAPNGILPYRAMQLVHRLKLHYAKDFNHAGLDAIEISETTITWRTVVGTVVSEFSSIVIAITTAVAEPFRAYWLSGYMLVPLALKICALVTSVRRDSILDIEEKTESHPSSEDELYELDNLTHGFALIQGSPSIVSQFWRHYGHPKRDSGAAGRRDRVRELLSIR
ncbi:hypothetical protein ASPVEDRAFT_715243 [Aspergillus versicolor CBS 583.65]|uniref:Uncharacterized protein n=1 Tax=Aspergillus versicolor CBS 583.65 TaxID=1036611 RepID=A0A1L9PNQ3_ASPVE|nr:uncharacterized protein ASPVEDRAFT_715243 [Aspergillus versicolor CBS 583.65]OJJ03133.1 hypothetical protein ASPVEDRAFT_715243 [Aspergillus versicolor CBS 583.65]